MVLAHTEGCRKRGPQYWFLEIVSWPASPIWLVPEALTTKLRLGLFWELTKIAHSTSRPVPPWPLIGLHLLSKVKKYLIVYICGHLYSHEQTTFEVSGIPGQPGMSWASCASLLFMEQPVKIFTGGHIQPCPFCYGQQLGTGWIQGLGPQCQLKSLSEDSSCASKKSYQRKWKQNGYKIHVK